MLSFYFHLKLRKIKNQSLLTKQICNPKLIFDIYTSCKKVSLMRAYILLKDTVLLILPNTALISKSIPDPLAYSN